MEEKGYSSAYKKRVNHCKTFINTNQKSDPKQGNEDRSIERLQLNNFIIEVDQKIAEKSNSPNKKVKTKKILKSLEVTPNLNMKPIQVDFFNLSFSKEKQDSSFNRKEDDFSLQGGSPLNKSLDYGRKINESVFIHKEFSTAYSDTKINLMFSNRGEGTKISSFDTHNEFKGNGLNPFNDIIKCRDNSHSPIYKIKKTENMIKMHDRYKEELTEFIKKHRYSAIMIGTKRFESQTGQEYLKTIDDLINVQRLKRNTLTVNRERERRSKMMNKKQIDLTPIPQKRRWKGFKFELEEYINAERTAVIMRRIEYSTNLIRSRNSIKDLEEAYLRLFCDKRIIKIQRWYRNIVLVRKQNKATTIIQRNFRKFRKRFYKLLQFKNRVITTLNSRYKDLKRCLFESLKFKWRRYKLCKVINDNITTAILRVKRSSFNNILTKKTIKIFMDRINIIREHLSKRNTRILFEKLMALKVKKSISIKKAEKEKFGQINRKSHNIAKITLIQKNFRIYLIKKRTALCMKIRKLMIPFKRQFFRIFHILRFSDMNSKSCLKIQSYFRGYLYRIPYKLWNKQKGYNVLLDVYLNFGFCSVYRGVKSKVHQFLRKLQFLVKIKRILPFAIDHTSNYYRRKILQKINKESFNIKEARVRKNQRECSLRKLVNLCAKHNMNKHFELWKKIYKSTRRKCLLSIILFQKLIRLFVWNKLSLVSFKKNSLTTSDFKSTEAQSFSSNTEPLVYLKNRPTKTKKMNRKPHFILNVIKRIFNIQRSKLFFNIMQINRNALETSRKALFFSLLIKVILKKRIGIVKNEIFNQLHNSSLNVCCFGTKRPGNSSADGMIRKIKLQRIVKKKQNSNSSTVCLFFRNWRMKIVKELFNTAALRLQKFIKLNKKRNTLRKLFYLKHNLNEVVASKYFHFWKRNNKLGRLIIKKANIMRIYMNIIRRSKAQAFNLKNLISRLSIKLLLSMIRGFKILTTFKC